MMFMILTLTACSPTISISKNAEVIEHTDKNEQSELYIEDGC